VAVHQAPQESLEVRQLAVQEFDQLSVFDSHILPPRQLRGAARRGRQLLQIVQ